MILLQLLPHFYRFPVRDLVHQRPKTIAVVHLYGVAKFVKEDVVDQGPGQEHQGEGKVDATAWRATSPMAFAVEYLYTRAGEAVAGGQIKQP